MKTRFQTDRLSSGDALSHCEKRETAAGWDLACRYKNLISGFQIGMAIPQRLQPGPVVCEISYFAPMSLAVLFLDVHHQMMRGIDPRPMNSFSLAATFFSFLLLFAYLVDHISIHVAFLIWSAVSVFLVLSYLGLEVGRAIRGGRSRPGLGDLSDAVRMFFIKGFSALTATIGCILTQPHRHRPSRLFVVMQVTTRIPLVPQFC